MLHRLPSLNALRAFEAAGRHLSFTVAATELHVTPGAVSQQVKQLEEALGTPLFRRLHRGLALTEAGQTLLLSLSEAFRIMAASLERVARSEREGTLTISILPSLAAKWLVPRLARFRERHPEIDVRISATRRVVSFEHEDVDLAIRHGLGNYPGLRSERLMGEVLLPVCSPRLLEGDPPLREPRELQAHTLLHDEMFNDWAQWLHANGVPEVDARRGPVFDDASLVLQAAIAGDGVALSRSVLAADDLAAGRLVQPFPASLPYRMAYFIVCPPHHWERPKVAAFRQWLHEEARATGRRAAADAGDAGLAAPPAATPGAGT